MKHIERFREVLANAISSYDGNQTTLAQVLGISRSAVSQLAKGHMMAMRPKKFDRLVDAVVGKGRGSPAQLRSAELRASWALARQELAPQVPGRVYKAMWDWIAERVSEDELRELGLVLFDVMVAEEDEPAEPKEPTST